MDVPAMLSELADHGFSDTGTARKVAVLQDAIYDIESREPWAFLEQTIDLTFSGVSGTPTNVPADFRSAISVKDLSTGIRVRWVTQQNFEQLMGPQADYTLSGGPQYYYIETGVPKFWPLPAATTTVRFKYHRLSPAISDQGAASLESYILLPPRHHRLIVLGALQRLYDMEDDPELAARFESQYEARMMRMKADLQKQQYDRPNTIQVVNDDDWDTFS
jgi:hypothetical protein